MSRQTGQVVGPLQVVLLAVLNMGTEFTDHDSDSQAVSCVEGISEQAGAYCGAERIVYALRLNDSA